MDPPPVNAQHSPPCSLIPKAGPCTPRRCHPALPGFLSPSPLPGCGLASPAAQGPWVTRLAAGELEAAEVRSSSRRQGSAQACLPPLARLCARPPAAFLGRGHPSRWAAAGCSGRAWEKPGLGRQQPQRATRLAGEGGAQGGSG